MLSRKLSGRLCDRAPRQHADEMGAILWARVDVAVHACRRYGHALERFCCETLLESLFKRFDPEHAVGTGTRYRYADVGAALGNEDANQCKARRRVLELFIGCLLRNRKANLGDDLVIFECR